MKSLRTGFSKPEILLHPHFNISQGLYNLCLALGCNLCREFLLQGSLVVFLIVLFDAAASLLVVWELNGIQ